MAHKRPFDDEVVDEGSSKHQRQDGPDVPSEEISLCNDSFPIEGASAKRYDVGESSIGNGNDKLELYQEHEKGSCHVIPSEVVEDVECDEPRSASLSHWATSSTSDDDEMPEELVQLPFYPGYFSFDHSVRPTISRDDLYYCLLDYPPRKQVPVGPDHQADVPYWAPQVVDNTSDASGIFETTASDRLSGGVLDGKLGGICIMPSPNIKPTPCSDEKVGDGRIDCICPDQGSIRCVQQHIAEARDKLRNTIGEDTFMELGFYDMGEVVAEKWSEEERQLFYEVVYSNPASLGKNFWNVLSAVFTSRTKMEIVSYYFNVFMLRIRAEQNRCDPMNIDSDNDEWHSSDDDGGDGVSDDDENSGIESPVLHHNNGPEFHQNGLHLHEDDTMAPEDDGDLSDEARENNGNNDCGIARKSGPNTDFMLHGKKSDDDGENDVQDGSCTSSDSGAPMQGPRLKPVDCHEWNDYIIDSSDAKVWDGFSLSCPKQSVDLLPTCSMIEEVFGDGHFESNGNRW